MWPMGYRPLFASVTYAPGEGDVDDFLIASCHRHLPTRTARLSLQPEGKEGKHEKIIAFQNFIGLHVLIVGFLGMEWNERCEITEWANGFDHQRIRL